MSERQALQDQVATHFSRAEDEATALSVLVAGLDGFRPVGDSLSAELRDSILEQFRDAVLSLSGSAYRLRGDIYAALVPGTSAQTAISLAEQLRETVARIVLTPIGEASVSLGVARLPRIRRLGGGAGLRGPDRHVLGQSHWRQQGRLLGRARLH